MRLNIPNLLTWLRILLIPVFLMIFYVPDTVISLHHKHYMGTLIFSLAACTDWLDGYLARKARRSRVACALIRVACARAACRRG